MWRFWLSGCLYVCFALVVTAVPLLALATKESQQVYLGITIPFFALCGGGLHYALLSRPLGELAGNLEKSLQQQQVCEEHQRKVVEMRGRPTGRGGSNPEVSLAYAVRYQQRIIDEMDVGSCNREILMLQAHVKDALQALLRFQQTLFKIQLNFSADEQLATPQMQPVMPKGGQVDGFTAPSIFPPTRNFTLDCSVEEEGEEPPRMVKTPPPQGMPVAAVAAGSPSGLRVASRFQLVTLHRGSRFPEDTKNICFYLERSKNKNIVVYEATVQPPAPLSARPTLAVKHTLRGYWLDLDPMNAEKVKKRGWKNDLNFVQKKFAYGVSYREHTHEPGSFAVEFVAFKKMAMTITLEAVRHSAAPEQSAAASSDEAAATAAPIEGPVCVEYLPVIISQLGGEACILEKGYVHAIDPAHSWSLPTVNYIDLFGFSLESGQMITERIIPE